MLLQGTGLFVTSGHTPVAEDGNLVTGDFETQVVAAYESLGRTLRAAGLTFGHVARLVTYVTDYEPSLVDTIRQVRSRYLSAENPPTSTLVGVAALYDSRIRIEIEAMAVVP
jgi:enamine deaminase RidA (YjgF/YER057c/UK114 family)